MSQNEDGHQKGAQDHAEGQQGRKTHQKFVENLHHRQDDDAGDVEANAARHGARAPGEPHDGGHRLFEERQQHDEAEKNSEKTRLAIERERGNEQGPDHSLNGPQRT